jgi:putative spermidine/putrescine transport system substrate-binding protein
MREFFVSPTNQKVVVPADLRQDVPVSGADMAKILTWDWDFVNANQTRLGESWAKTFS